MATFARHIHTIFDAFKVNQVIWQVISLVFQNNIHTSLIPMSPGNVCCQPDPAALPAQIAAFAWSAN